MPVPQEFINMSIEDYLAFEEASEIKHEYINGQLFAMTGASKPHNLISGNLYTMLRAHLRGSGCHAYIDSVKVLIKVLKTFYYPDVVVTCEPSSASQYYTETPKLICEVLSPSTQEIDRREKFTTYKRLNSLQEYILVHQDKHEVELYRRSRRDDWTMMKYVGSDDFELLSLPNGTLLVSLDALYEDVTLLSP